MGRAERGVLPPRSGARRGLRSSRAVTLALLAALVVPLVSGCSFEEAIRFGWPEGVTPQAHAMRDLWIWSCIAALIVGVVTWGAMFWAVAFHRKRKGDDSEVPRQTQYNLPLEIVFTVLPTIIVAVLFGFTVVVQNYVDIDEPNPEVQVKVIGFQWNWEFQYTGQTGADGRPVSEVGSSDRIPILVLPTEQRIEFEIQSNDVIHSFFVPDFLFKRDVFPRPDVNDTDNRFQIDRIDRQGAFVGRCAELCGAYHSAMNFEVRALSPDLYSRYIGLRKQVNPATGVGYTTPEALGALNCGELCAPLATTTYPLDTDRARRSATIPPAG